jgi:hypothetical protein
MKKILILIVLVTTFISCESGQEETPVPNGPLISCEYFSNLKPTVLDYNEKGLNIGLTIEANMQTANVKSYSITYGVVGDLKKRTIESTQPLADNLNTILLDSLVCGLEYEIKATITTTDNTVCTSKLEYFTALKSFIPSPWCAAIFKNDTGYDRSFGVSINNKPYIIFQNNSFYSVEDESVLTQKSPFPLSGNTGVEYGIFTIGKYGYFKSSDSTDLYRYDSETNSWENLGTTNLYTYIKYFGGQVNDIGYLFDTRKSYRYDVSTNSFTQLSSYVEEEFINTFQTNLNIYAINKNFEIRRFNTSTGSWEYKATYPGNKSQSVVSFVINNKVYIGLAHNYHYPGHESFYDIYELNLDTNNWKQLASFPYAYDNAWGIGSVSTTNNSYIIYRNPFTAFSTFVWKFNPLEIIYK